MKVFICLSIDEACKEIIILFITLSTKYNAFNSSNITLLFNGQLYWNIFSNMHSGSCAYILLRHIMGMKSLEIFVCFVYYPWEGALYKVKIKYNFTFHIARNIQLSTNSGTCTWHKVGLSLRIQYTLMSASIYCTVQKSHYPPGNHHASHFLKCPISRS